MPSEVILPRVDMDMATGKISKWLVAPGASVAKGQPLFEIETDKATMEIEAEAAGTIRDLAEAGSADIPVGSTVAWIYAEGEAPRAPAAPSTAAPPPPSRAAEPTAAPAVAAPTPVAAADLGGRTRATPLARRLARDHGIDIGTLRGSGPRGRVQAADIAVGRDRPVASAAPPPPAAALREPQADARDPRPERMTEAGPKPASIAAGTDVKTLRKGTGNPLLFVHGFGSEANSWRPLLQSLTLTRPALALDLPGHGTAALGDVAGFDALVEAVSATAAGLGPVDVVAHSLGAAVMTAVAARGDADIRSLLLLSPAGLGPEINGAFVQGYLDAGSEASLTPWMRELVADPQVVTPPFVRATLKSREGTDRVAAQRRLAGALFPDGTQSFSTRTDLAALRVPTRIVFGTADRIIPARHATGLPGLVALHLLPGVGHMPQLEARDAVAAILGQMTAW